ncbi:glycosyltransferase [Erythrobacter litoralis]|uniref:Probable inner membrane transmembrane protein n=1 Tax=Erythrobacter litoralis (strain HTCC2594) TaxID=314225 RepID=Q2NDA0_ERYLH|nr:glycosyltransferase [Erythrobacter litoralis]ABC62341.1 probable inner membrane transmembrane protein [Erythrobacter litoralis HTCC2594]
MNLAGLTAGECLVLVQYELLLFAGLFFLLGALDELIVDAVWLWLRLTGRGETIEVRRRERSLPLEGKSAVFIPAWQEANVIGTTVEHMLSAWPQRALRLYVGCYRNDPATLAAIVEAAPGDPRLRVVIHDCDGPTTKADCLNRLYRAVEEDEARSGERCRMVLLHDAEDMVDPAALELCGRAIASADFIQLPVLPEPQKRSRWIGSHYCEEFAEAHGKAMVVRDALMSWSKKRRGRELVVLTYTPNFVVRKTCTVQEKIEFMMKVLLTSGFIGKLVASGSRQRLRLFVPFGQDRLHLGCSRFSPCDVAEVRTARFVEW